MIIWFGTTDQRGGGLTINRQPVDPFGYTATITVMSTDRVNSGSFSSRYCAFRRKHTSADPIRLLSTRLALPSTLSLPSRFAPSARLMLGVLPRALWLAGPFLCDCTFSDVRGGGLTRQPVGHRRTQQHHNNNKHKSRRLGEF